MGLRKKLPNNPAHSTHPTPLYSLQDLVGHNLASGAPGAPGVTGVSTWGVTLLSFCFSQLVARDFRRSIETTIDSAGSWRQIGKHFGIEVYTWVDVLRETGLRAWCVSKRLTDPKGLGIVVSTINITTSSPHRALRVNIMWAYAQCGHCSTPPHKLHYVSMGITQKFISLTCRAAIYAIFF